MTPAKPLAKGLLPPIKMPLDYVLPVSRSMGLSASKIESFHQCKAKFRAEFIQKSIPFVETEAIKEGKKTHLALEQLINTNGEFIDDVIQIYKLNDFTVDKLANVLLADGVKYAEFKFGITDDMNDCVPLKANWDKQSNKQPYLYTGSMDVRVVNGIYTTIMDWKTGKVYKPYMGKTHGQYSKPAALSPIEEMIQQKRLQMDMYALAEFMLNPECQYIKAIYVFTTYGEVQHFMYSRKDDFERLRAIFFKEAQTIWWEINSWTQAAADGKTCLMLEKVTPLCGWCGARENCIPFNQSLGARK